MKLPVGKVGVLVGGGGSVTVRLVLGLLFTVAAFAVAGRRVWWLSRLIRTGQPAPGRMERVPARLRVEATPVRCLLRAGPAELMTRFTTSASCAAFPKIL